MVLTFKLVLNAFINKVFWFVISSTKQNCLRKADLLSILSFLRCFASSNLNHEHEDINICRFSVKQINTLLSGVCDHMSGL